jgi:GTP-binding protein
LKLPSIVIVGRPNVGKSTLFNRICGKRKALVGNEPGITRDRITAHADWRGLAFEVIDTGGIIPGDSDLIHMGVFTQARTAIQKATVVFLVVDVRAGLTPADAELAGLLRQTGKPIFLVANKSEGVRQEWEAHEFHRLGLSQVFAVSAEHGSNLGELLDEALKLFPQQSSDGGGTTEDVIGVAIIGKPNVGKSTLLNRLAGEERAIVSPIPGTTRDAVDTLVRRDGRLYRFIDTAGIRKKSQTHLMAEKLSVVMARKSLERCDVALVVIDAVEGVTAMDATIAGYTQEAGVSVILAVNKWDAVPKQTQTMRDYEREVRDRLKYLDYAPMVFFSAQTGQRVPKLFPLIDQSAESRMRRISTAQLNSFMQRAALEKAAIPQNKQVKVYYMTQIAVAPPRFAVFTNSRTRIHFSLERYLINQIRSQFGFVGTPIFLKQKFKHGRSGDSQ